MTLQRWRPTWEKNVVCSCRCFLPGKALHLQRGCPWAFTQSWAERLQDLLFAHVSATLHACPLSTLNATQRCLRLLTLSMGGAELSEFPQLTLGCRATAIAQLPDRPWMRDAVAHMYAFEMDEISSRLKACSLDRTSPRSSAAGQP